MVQMIDREETQLHTDPDENGEVHTLKPFQQFLLEQRHGGLHSELSEKLAELAAAVAEHGKEGSISLRIKVKPLKEASDQYLVTDEVKVSAPEGNRGGSLFFADDRGNLSRSNPRQPELPFREVPRSDQTAREVRA